MVRVADILLSYMILSTAAKHNSAEAQCQDVCQGKMTLECCECIGCHQGMRFGKRSIPEAPAQQNPDVKYLDNSKFENMNLAKSCLPGYPFGGYPYSTGTYNPYLYSGLYPRLGGIYREPAKGPTMASGSFASGSQPHFAAQFDDVAMLPIASLNELNCESFEHTCRWKNTEEDALQWSTLNESPGADKFLDGLGTETIPSIILIIIKMKIADLGSEAAVLSSETRKGWDSGQLLSDPLPCIPQGLKITATGWRTKSLDSADEPKLQICSKNVNEDKFPLVRCNEFEIRNGVPMTAEVPVPNQPGEQAQDIVLDGTLQCNGANADTNPVLINDASDKLNDINSQMPVGPLKAVDGAPSGLEALNPGAIFPPQNTFQDPSMMAPQGPQMTQFNAVPVGTGSQQAMNPVNPLSPTLFETCLALSCNPSDLSCKFWRSSGNNRWEIGSAGRISNPLTGIHLPPGTAQKFLVAPFLDSHISSYALVSESLTVPPLKDVYFCFYEYYATHGLSLSVCTDKMDCFYKKSGLAMGENIDENKKWNIRCPKLPVGTYELRVIAENGGDNKGEVGFLPIRLAYDAEGKQLIC
ncbi:hypothetical protein WR25_26237 [Diploscapter pachys]|uniref:MAM domain-containing protein n=1 Tax=Diploscapter pachys TaxID=2018661 RepID=A0A2A2JSW4_9BILA|nr:hypothetical protein WR25_26237 [Diploscapter pachys]